MTYNYRMIDISISLMFLAAFILNTAANNAVSVTIQCENGRCEGGRYCAVDPNLPDNHAEKQLCLPCSLLCLNCGAVHNSTDCQRFCPRFFLDNPSLANSQSTTPPASNLTMCSKSNHVGAITGLAIALAVVSSVAIALAVALWLQYKPKGQKAIQETGLAREDVQVSSRTNQEGPCPPNDPTQNLLRDRS